MKKIVAIILSLGIAFSLLSTGAFAVNEKNDVKKVESTVEAYLRKCVDSIYYYKHQDFSGDTIKAILIANNDKVEKLKKEIPSFTQFKNENGFSIMKQINSTKTDSESLQANLQLQDDYITYFAHLYETQKITYSYFNQNYVFNNITISGDYAVIDITQYLDYQYSFCNEPTSEITNYNIALIYENNKWMIATVTSDDLFFLSTYDTDFDLQTEIKGYDDSLSQ